jgi:hypothetical protein
MGRVSDLTFGDSEPPEPTPIRPKMELWPDPQSVRLANAYRQGNTIVLDFIDMTVSWGNHTESMVVPPRRPR